MKGRHSLPQFTDKTALLLLLILSDPKRKWHIHDFQKVGVSAGRTSEILTALHRADLVKREHRGKFSYTAAVSPQRLIAAWTEAYSFSMNRCLSFRSESKNLLPELKKLFEKEQTGPCALTLHSGANLLAPYVKSDEIHAYLHPQGFEQTLSSIVRSLGLKQYLDTGDIHFCEPYYREAVFRNTQIVRGFRVVSSLQLYLDLFHHGLRGYEHAAHLKKTLEERGINLW